LPDGWLKRAAKERDDGNEDRAVKLLRHGFQAWREPLAAVALDLAGHHASLAPDYGAGHLAEAERLARLGALLDPADEDARALLAEILAVRAGEEETAGRADTPKP
jgi:hypothetical protein